MAKLAVALYEPGAGLFLCAWLCGGVGEGTGTAGGACADFEEFAGNMGEIFSWRWVILKKNISKIVDQ